MFEFDLKSQIGIANKSVTTEIKTNKILELGFTAVAAAAIRWNYWQEFSLSANFDYLLGLVDFEYLSSYGFMIGLNYRLK